MSLFVPLGMGPDRRESLHQAFCYRAGDETGWIGSQEQYMFVCLLAALGGVAMGLLGVRAVVWARIQRPSREREVGKGGLVTLGRYGHGGRRL